MTETAPDRQASALKSMAGVEIKRGEAAGKLTILELELKESRLMRARIALEAVAGDAEALAEYERLRAREPDLERRAERLIEPDEGEAEKQLEPEVPDDAA
jgi:hypothetical protein